MTESSQAQGRMAASFTENVQHFHNPPFEHGCMVCGKSSPTCLVCTECGVDVYLEKGSMDAKAALDYCADKNPKFAAYVKKFRAALSKES